MALFVPWISSSYLLNAVNLAYLHQVALNFEPSTRAIQHTVTVWLSIVWVSGTEHAHYCIYVTVLVDRVAWQLTRQNTQLLMNIDKFVYALIITLFNPVLFTSDYLRRNVCYIKLIPRATVIIPNSSLPLHSRSLMLHVLAFAISNHWLL